LIWILGEFHQPNTGILISAELASKDIVTETGYVGPVAPVICCTECGFLLISITIPV
jgi:hypothetical protein